MWIIDDSRSCLVLFNKANCLLECAWINAAKTCDCIPWYLNQVLPEYKLCNIFSIEHCFDTLVRKRFNSKHHKSDEAQSCYSQCLPDCEFVELKVDIKVSRLAKSTTFQCFDVINLSLDYRTLCKAKSILIFCKM